MYGFTWDAEVRGLYTFSKNSEGKVGVEGSQHLLLLSFWAVPIPPSHTPLHIPPSLLYQGYLCPLFFLASSGMPLLPRQFLRVPQGRGSMICFSNSAHLLISCLRNVSNSQELSWLRHLAWKPVVSARINPSASCFSGFRTIPTPTLGKVF